MRYNLIEMRCNLDQWASTCRQDNMLKRNIWHHTRTNCPVGLPGPAVPVQVMVGLDPGLLWDEASFDESRQGLSLLVSNFEEIASTRPGESTASAPWQGCVGDVDDKFSYPQYFSCNPMFVCLARLKQSNDRVGIRYTRHSSQLMEPSQFLRLLQFRCSWCYL